jgi:hypothetical protein
MILAIHRTARGERYWGDWVSPKLPIVGNVEATCASLVGRRMKLTTSGTVTRGEAAVSAHFCTV